ncbi:MAG: apolipoprotein N-acyltransferase [Pirellulaceae bacterium]
MQPRSNKPESRAENPPPASFWRSPTLWLALAGSLLLWASFPPLDLWPLAWLAPLPWLWLVLLPTLPGRRPYLAIGLAGFVFWLAMLFGISLAHPALIAGWIALSWYLAFYLPVFVGLTRVAVHRLGVSIVVAAPVVWVGLELVRGHLLTGFSMGLLSHTQVRFPLLLQIADLGGAYAVSFVMLLVTAALARTFPLPLGGNPRLPSTLWPALAAAAVLLATLGYGAYRLAETPPGAARKPLRVALIQGSLDTKFEYNPERAAQAFEHYGRLTDQARRENERLDLVVWPESMFVLPEYRIEEPLAAPAGSNIPVQAMRSHLTALNSEFGNALAREAARVNTLADGSRQATPVHLLVNVNTWVYGPGDRERSYNTALLANPQGEVVGRYSKVHPVMFGEYIPLAEAFPWLYRLTPMTGGLTVGTGPETFDVAGLALSPSICFESVVPHLIRRQVIELNQAGTPPDFLVNLTNDGWFWGTAMLDHHFRCSVFRAVENRKPMLIAANTGISGWIDGNGRILSRGPRRDTAILIAQVRPDGRESPYHWIGDWPAWLCVAFSLALAAVGWKTRRNNRAR